MPALIVVAPVYEVILVIRALETVGQGYLGVAGTDRSLIEQIAPVPVGQIMQIETMGCIGDRAVHHGVVIAVEDIDLLTGDVVRVVDIPVASPVVGLLDERLESGRVAPPYRGRSRSGSPDIAGEPADRSSLRAVIGTARDDPDVL